MLPCDNPYADLATSPHCSVFANADPPFRRSRTAFPIMRSALFPISLRASVGTGHNGTVIVAVVLERCSGSAVAREGLPVVTKQRSASELSIASAPKVRGKREFASATRARGRAEARKSLRVSAKRDRLPHDRVFRFPPD